MGAVDTKDGGEREVRTPFGARNAAAAPTPPSAGEAAPHPAPDACRLLRSGLPDEEVERLANITLCEVIALRGALAAATGADTAPF